MSTRVVQGYLKAIDLDFFQGDDFSFSLNIHTDDLPTLEEFESYDWSATIVDSADVLVATFVVTDFLIPEVPADPGDPEAEPPVPPTEAVPAYVTVILTLAADATITPGHHTWSLISTNSTHRQRAGGRCLIRKAVTL